MDFGGVMMIRIDDLSMFSPLQFLEIMRK